MRTVSVNIGSNLGDREQNLRAAVKRIRRIAGTPLRLSKIYESQAWGYHSDNPFLNIAVEFHSDRPLADLLAAFRKVERDLGSLSHRTPDGSYADRTVDIDIICAGNETVATETLCVPHPRMAERRFVLVPLCELSPTWRHPIIGLTAAEMLRQLDENDK